jgi:hypothetical protein
MTLIHPDLEETLDAAEVVSPTRYTLLGEPRDVPEADTDGPAGGLEAALAIDLYQRLYLRPRAAAAASTVDDLGRRDLVRTLVPGFYVALGDAEEDPDDPGDDSEPRVRYYWHLTCESAAPLVRETAARLNAAGVPFVLKVRNDPAGFRRADAGVLFVRRRYLGRLGGTIDQVHAAVTAGLRPEVPLFTMWLGHGLAVAEDPGGGQSFGQHRCGLAARALWRSFLRGDVRLEARARTMADTFLEIGLDPTRPFLGPGAKVAGPNPWDRR